MRWAASSAGTPSRRSSASASFSVVPMTRSGCRWHIRSDPLIGWFISGAATAEAQQAVLASRLRGIRASQVMTPDPVTVPGSMTVGEFVDDYLLRARHQSFPVTGDGGETVTGLVTLDRIKHVPGR